MTTSESASSGHFSGIDHHSVIISDLEKSRHFYINVVGLEEDTSRPEMVFEGLWFKVGQQAIHCLKLNNPDPVEDRPEHGGRDRHVCLITDDMNPLIERLEKYYVDFTHSKSGRRAIFFRDPDGNAVEVQER
jgi:glyoxylase I family protein